MITSSTPPSSSNPRSSSTPPSSSNPLDNDHSPDIDMIIPRFERGPEIDFRLSECLSEILVVRKTTHMKHGSHGQKIFLKFHRATQVKYCPGSFPSFEDFANETSLHFVSWKLIMLIPSLIVQKTHAKTKAEKHSDIIAKCLALWRTGHIAKLSSSGQCFQNNLPSVNAKLDADSLNKCFLKIVLEGNIKIL